MWSRLLHVLGCRLGLSRDTQISVTKQLVGGAQRRSRRLFFTASRFCFYFQSRGGPTPSEAVGGRPITQGVQRSKTLGPPAPQYTSIHRACLRHVTHYSLTIKKAVVQARVWRKNTKSSTQSTMVNAKKSPPKKSMLHTPQHEKVPHTLVLVKQGARARSSHLPLEAEDGVIETEHLAVLAALLERVDLLTPLAKQRRQQLDHGARRVRQRLRRAARRRAPGMDVSWTRHSRGEGRLRRVGSTRRTCTPRPAGRGNMRAERGTASRAPR